MADEQGYVLRRLAEVYEATADFEAPGETTRLSKEFDAIWALGEIHQELRRLHL